MAAPPQLQQKPKARNIHRTGLAAQLARAKTQQKGQRVDLGQMRQGAAVAATANLHLACLAGQAGRVVVAVAPVAPWVAVVEVAEVAEVDPAARNIVSVSMWYKISTTHGRRCRLIKDLSCLHSSTMAE